VTVSQSEVSRRLSKSKRTRRPEPPGEDEPRLAAGGTTEAAAGGRPSLLALWVVVFLAILPFLNTFGNDFAFDDKLAIVENPRIKSLLNIPTLLASGYWAQYPRGGTLYRPLVTISYALNYAAGGLHPFGYHLVNLLLHLGVSLLLYRLAVRLFHHREGALVAAALFAVHPLHTEAVTGIVGRAELFAAVFFLLAWWWDLESRGRWRYMLGSLVAFGLALISKEHAVTLPAVLVLSDLYTAKEREGQPPPEGGQRFPGGVSRYAGFLAVLAGYILIRFAVVGTHLPRPPLLDNPLGRVTLIPRLLTALEVAGRYLWLMVWPQRLSPDYSYNQIPILHSPMAPGFLLALLAWGTLIGIACRSYRGSRRAFLCVGFTLVTFSLASNFLIPIGTIMGERLFYLPSAGLCLLAGVAWQRVAEWRRRATPSFVRGVGPALMAAVIVLLSVRTVLRNRDWQDHMTLFLHAVEVAPNSAKVHSNLGGAYLDRGLYDAGFRELNASLAILPTPQAHRNLGTAYLHKGLVEAATAEYRAALKLDPRDPEANNDLGYVLLSQGFIEEAITSLRKALVLDPDLADAHYTLGRALAEQEHWPEAIAAYQEARRLKPDFVEASYALGLALEASGQIRAAADAFEQVLRLKPGLEMAHRRLAELYRTLGDPQKAQEHLRQAGTSE
jgi:Tfp pilus assembly protein PilF